MRIEKDGRQSGWRIGPAEKHIGTIYRPDRNATETTTSVAFGDEVGKGLYITGLRSLYHIRLRRSAW